MEMCRNCGNHFAIELGWSGYCDRCKYDNGYEELVEEAFEIDESAKEMVLESKYYRWRKGEVVEVNGKLYGKILYPNLLKVLTK